MRPGQPSRRREDGRNELWQSAGANFDGLSVDELIAHGLAAPAAIFPPSDSTETRTSPFEKPGLARGSAPGRVHIDEAPEGMRVRTADTPGYAAETPLLTAPADGTYLFRLRFRPEAGRLTLGVLSKDRNSWLAIGYGNEPLGVDAVRTLAVKLRSGQVFSLVASNGAPKAGERSVYVFEELAAYQDKSTDGASASAKWLILSVGM